MTDTHVYLCQALCGPARHAIIAVAGAFDSQEEAKETLAPIARESLERAVTLTVQKPWCALCRSPMTAWIYETGRTRFKTMEEAQPVLDEQQRQQALTNALFARHN